MPTTSEFTLDRSEYHTIRQKMEEALFQHLHESNFANKAREFAQEALTQYENSGSADKYQRIMRNLKIILKESTNTYKVEQFDSEEPLTVKDDACLLDFISFFCRTTSRPWGGRLNPLNRIFYQLEQLLVEEDATQVYGSSQEMSINDSYRKVIEHQNNLIQYQRRGFNFPQLVALRTANSQQVAKIGVMEKQLAQSRIRDQENTRKVKDLVQEIEKIKNKLAVSQQELVALRTGHSIRVLELEQEIEKIKNKLAASQRDFQAARQELIQYQTRVSPDLLPNRTPLVAGLSFFRSQNSSNTKISDLFVCPLTQEVISNPVVAADGMTYEESGIREWLYDYNKDTSPLTRSKLSNKSLIPNQTIIDAKDKFLLKLIIVCPLNNTVMEEPVIAADGYTYEKKAIEAWFKQKAVSPMTNKSVPNTTLITNQAIKSVIIDYKSSQLDIQSTGSATSRIG